MNRTVKFKDMDLMICNITAIYGVRTSDDGRALLNVGMNDQMVYSSAYASRLAAETAREKLIAEINGVVDDHVIGIAMSDSTAMPDGNHVDVKIGDFVSTKSKS